MKQIIKISIFLVVMLIGKYTIGQTRTFKNIYYTQYELTTIAAKKYAMFQILTDEYNLNELYASIIAYKNSSEIVDTFRWDSKKENDNNLIEKGLCPHNLYGVSNMGINSKDNNTKKITYKTIINTSVLDKYKNLITQNGDDITFIITTDFNPSNISLTDSIVSEKICKSFTNYFTSELTSIITSKKYTVIPPNNQSVKIYQAQNTTIQHSPATFELKVSLNGIEVNRSGKEYILQNPKFVFSINDIENNTIIASESINDTCSFKTSNGQLDNIVAKITKKEAQTLCCQSIQFNANSEISLFSSFNKYILNNGFTFKIYIENIKKVNDLIINKELTKLQTTYKFSKPVIQAKDTFITATLTGCFCNVQNLSNDFKNLVKKDNNVDLQILNAEQNYVSFKEIISDNDDSTNNNVPPPSPTTSNIVFISQQIIILDPAKEFDDFKMPQNLDSLQITIEDNLGNEITYLKTKKYNNKIKITLSQGRFLWKGRQYDFTFNGNKTMSAIYK